MGLASCMPRARPARLTERVAALGHVGDVDLVAQGLPQALLEPVLCTVQRGLLRDQVLN